MTLAETREKRALKVVQERLPYTEFVDAAAEYDRVCGQLATWEHKRNSASALVQGVVELVLEHDGIVKWLADFHLFATSSLRRELVRYFKKIDLTWLHQQIRQSGKLHVAKCQALQKKGRYYADMIAFVEQEIADRRHRIASIQRVRNTWRRSRKSLFWDDKSRWLVKIPDMKYEGARKRCTWLRTIRENLRRYEHYHQFSAFTAGMAGFLAYDAFALVAQKPMPYEGFTNTVIPEISAARPHGGRPDRAGMRRFLRENDNEWMPFADWDWENQEEFLLDEAYDSEAELALSENALLDAS